jgi:hypothetical protein
LQETVSLCKDDGSCERTKKQTNKGSITAGAVGATPPPGFLDKLSAFFQGGPITLLDMIEGWKQQAADGLTGSAPTPMPNQGVVFGDPVTVPNGFLWILDVATHGWGVHGPDGEDDLNGFSKDQYTKLILDTVQNASGGDVRHVGPGKTAYWNDKEGFIVVKNKNSPATGTAFFPSEGKDYFDDME